MAFKLRVNRVESLRIEENTVDMTAVNMADKSNESRQTAPESLRSFINDTTLHGARFLFVGNILRRCLWTLALISCFGYCVYQVYQAVDEFGDWPFTTRITTKRPRKSEDLPFPAVTLCNYNSFNRRRFITELPKLENWSTEVIQQKIKIYEEIMKGSRTVFTNQSILTSNPELTWRFHGDNISLYYLVLFSHRIEDMLLPSSKFDSCFINGKRCGSTNFTSFYSTVFGKCFTFNSGQDNSPVINTTMAGSVNGLHLLLNIERDSYLANEIINLEKPYSTNCTNRRLEMLRNTRYAYSHPACMLQCLTQLIIRNCSCRPIEYKDTDIPLCSPKDVMSCVLLISEKFGASKEKEKCEENCAQPCTHTKYKTSLSYSGLQRNVFISKLNSAAKKHAIYEHFLNMSTSKKKEYIDENIISLDVYFEDLSYDEIEQTPKFETWTLISTLGGNFGLFLGMSILTILEFLDFTFRRICFLIWKI